MKYLIKGVRASEEFGSDNSWHEYTVEENISVASYSQALETDPVLLALVTTTASKMLETHEKVQVLLCDSFRYGGEDIVLYEMKKSQV